MDQNVRMLNFGQDVVAGMYPLKIVHYGEAVESRVAAGENLQSAQTRYVGLLEEREQRQTLDGFATGTYAGCGFMMISRSALQTMAKAYPDANYLAAHTSERPSLSRNQYDFFGTMIDPDTREYLSEDYAFCRRWRDIGGKVWLDTRSRLGHVGSREFVGDAAQRYRPE